MSDEPMCDGNGECFRLEAELAALRQQVAALRDKWTAYRAQQTRYFAPVSDYPRSAREHERDNVLMQLFLDDLALLTPVEETKP